MTGIITALRWIEEVYICTDSMAA